MKSYYMHYIASGKKEGRAGTGCKTLQGTVTVYNGVDYSAVLIIIIILLTMVI